MRQAACWLTLHLTTQTAGMKALLSRLLHNAGIMYSADNVRFHLHRLGYARENSKFRREHPGFALPPDYLLYESYGLRYTAYAEGGERAARWLLDVVRPWLLDRNASSSPPLSVLDWGCGPARMIRHLPALLPPGSQVYGTDYNRQSVDWCRRHLPNIRFNHNGLQAALPYADATFDLVYGISIFTHLPLEQHYSWFAELLRVTAPRQLLVFTTQGRAFLSKLTGDERREFDSGRPVFRGLGHPGHRTCSAFHPPPFMRSLFEPCELLLHLERPPDPGKPLPQDVWVLRKKG